MKKTLLFVAFAMVSVMGMAKEFTDQLVVTVNDAASTQTTTVTVEELEDNYINFVLGNFILKNGDDNMYVGNIEVANLFLSDKGDYKSFSYNGNLKIKEGNLEGVDADSWVGPLLGNVPLILKGKLADDKLFVTIDIDMQASLEQTIYVKFGSDTFAKPSVTNTLNLSNTLSLQLTSTYSEDYGTVTKYDDTPNYKVIVEELSTGDINLKLNDIVLSLGGESAPLGSLTFNDVETVDRGSYKDFTWTGTAVFENSEMMAGAELPTVVRGKYSKDNICFTINMDANYMFSIIDFACGSDFAPATVVGEAKTYPDNLVVTVNESSTDPMPATVLVENLNNGGINFVLKNFTMELEGNKMYVGNIRIEDLPLYQGQGYNYFNYDGNLLIQPGDLAGVEEDEWIGPMLEEIPLRMSGRLNDDKLYVTIDIDMVSLEQIIHVTFGTQIEATDAIEGVVVDTTNRGAIYDLLGRRVNKPMKGIYIINGKKVLK